MDEAVAHKDNEPVFYMRDLFFTRLVVDVLDYVVFGNHLHYTVYYAATSKFKLPTYRNIIQIFMHKVQDIYAFFFFIIIVQKGK